MNNLVPMMLPSTEAPADVPHLLDEVGHWKVYRTPYSLRDATAGYSVVQPLTADPSMVVEEAVRGGELSFACEVTLPLVSLSPHLFHRGAQVVALYAPEEASETEVLDVACELYGRVEPAMDRRSR